MSKKKTSSVDALAQITKEMAEGREYTSGRKESALFATALTKLPLESSVIKQLSKHELFRN